MGLTLSQTPNVLELIDDGILFQINTTDYKTTSGSQAFLKIELTDYPVVSDKFTLSFGSVEIEFEIVAYNATPTNYQIRGKAPTHSTVAQWLADAIDDINANYYIRRNFDAVVTAVGGDFIELTAKENGAEFTLTLTESHSWLTEDTNTAGTSDVFADQFKILLALYHKNDTLAGSFERIIDLDAAPNTDNKAVFEINELLAGLASYYLPSPASASYVDRLTDQVKQYYVEVAYKSKDNPQPLGVVQSSTFKAMPGGTSKLFRDEHADFTDYLDTNPNRFLSWHPLNKTIGTAQLDYLYWLCHADLAQGFYVDVTCYYTNGESTEFTQVKTFSFGNQHEVYRIRADYALVSGLSHGGKTVAYYDVWLTDEDDDTQITEKRRFIVDANKVHQDVVIGFYNGFGIFETARFIGRVVATDAVSSEYFDAQIDIDSTFEDSNFLRANVEVAKSIVLQSGLLSSEHKIWAADFASANQHFILLNDEWVPVRLSNQEIADQKNEPNFTLRAQFALNYQDKHVANDYLKQYL